jgi:hypothetical protein
MSMAVKTVPDVIQITVKGTVVGRPWASIWHMRMEDGFIVGGGNVTDVVRDFADNWQDHIMTTTISDRARVDEFQYLVLDDTEGETGVIGPDPNKPLTGSWARAIASPSLCFLVRKSAGSRRGARSGRAYLPGLAEEAVQEDGTIEPTQLAGFNTKLQEFLDGISDDTGLDTGGHFPVVCHFPPEARTKGPHIVAGTSSRITALTLDTMAATQRRRMRG